MESASLLSQTKIPRSLLVHLYPFIPSTSVQSGKLPEYNPNYLMFGISEKFSNAFAGTVPVHLVLTNEKIVFFGPVQAKSPQSAKFAHFCGGSKK
jgi:hypothetical protein